MREKTFRKPTPRELFNMQGIKDSTRINQKVILELIDSRILVPVGDSYEQAVKTVEELQDGCFALFDKNFRISKQESDYGIKSLEGLVKIDSRQTLREISGEENPPRRLTRKFAEKYKIWPYTLIKNSMEKQNLENPPMGFYWVGLDSHVKGTTWLRSTMGAEMQIMKQRGAFFGEVIDKKPYGRNLRVRVNSRTEEGKEYEFTLFRLPMHGTRNTRQFSDWINVSHNSGDPDASYRGGEHEKRVLPVCFWSASTIFSFYDAMVFVRGHPEWRQFKVNPFPIPKNEEMIDYIDNLRLRSFILDDEKENFNLTVFNKSGIDRLIGARTILRGYDNCWHHWGKKDLSFLYKVN